MQLESADKTAPKRITPWVILGMLWSSPNSLIGIIIAGLFRGQWSLWGTTLESQHYKGILARICSRLGIAAFTCGNVVIYLTPPTINLRAHEGRHTWQAYWLGPFFLPVYFVLMALYGYRRHPMETDARAHEYRICNSIGLSKLMGRSGTGEPDRNPLPGEP